MDTSKLPNAQEFRWIAEENSFLLKINENTILALTDETPTRASFEWDAKTYQIKTERFWNPITVIKNYNDTLLSLRWDILGNKARIEFASGNRYACKIKNSPLASLTFMTDSGAEFLSYKIQASSNRNSVQSILTIFPNVIPREELIILIVLGFYSFKGVMIENQTSDLLIMTAGAS